MYRTLTEVIALDHIAEMQREAATMRLAKLGGGDHASSTFVRATSPFRSVAAALSSIRRTVVRA